MDSVKLICQNVCDGFTDSIKNILVIYLDRETVKTNKTSRKVDSRKESANPKDEKSPVNKEKTKKSSITARVFQCCMLNGGVFLLSILFFDYLLLPSIEFITFSITGESSLWNLIQKILSYLFTFLWVVPLFVLSKIINTFWFQDIADAAYECRKGRPTLIPSISKLLADVVFSLIVQMLFLVQSVSLSYIPYVGKVLCFLHICLLYSLYSFEYKWFNQGFELHKRLTMIESNWAYYVGFGLSLATLTQISNSLVINGCLFSIFFPLFILSGNESEPHRKLNCPLKFFALAVTVSNLVVSRKLGSKSKSLQKGQGPSEKKQR